MDADRFLLMEGTSHPGEGAAWQHAFLPHGLVPCVATEPAGGSNSGYGGKSMFARVSTFKTGPETLSDAPSEDIVSRVLQIPGCKGVYYLNGKETDKAIAITLWDSEEAMAASREEANRIRKDTSEEEKTQIVDVEEFEVTASSLNG